MMDLAFIFFCLVTIAAAAAVVLAKNAIYSAFGLVLSFFGLATLYLLWGATFISMVQILIYAGAIVVLFVFVVMLLNLERPPQHSHNWFMVAVSGVGAWLLSLLLLRVFSHETATGAVANPPALRTVAELLFTQYLWPFEVLTVFLLALIVGIYLLARPEKEEV